MSIDEAMKLAMEHHAAGRLHQAEQIYRSVLQQFPGHPDALHLLGVLAQQVGRLDVSIELISRAIAVNPRVGVYYSNLAEAYRKAGILDRAEDACRQAIRLQPDSPAAHLNLGVVLHARGQLQQAEAALRRAVQLQPNLAAALTALANVRLAQGDVEAAIDLGRRAVAADPTHAAAHNNLATALESKDLLQEAECEYRKAIELEPRCAEFFNNLGNTVRKLGDLPQAIRCWQHALELRPDYLDAQNNLGMAYLAVGDFARGWPLLESRFKRPPGSEYCRQYSGIPRWTGFDLLGKTILLYPEQGYGDVIQFARFIRPLADLGATVIFHCPAELVTLMKGVDGMGQVIGPDQPLPSFDTHQALLSVPWVLKTTLETLPAKVPYIRVDPTLLAVWRDRVKEYPEKLKVGLAWAGRPTHADDKHRSMPLKFLQPLVEVSNVRFFSLQKGQASAQLAEVSLNFPVVDLQNELHDFADTAAAIANLDLVISVDTVIVHLAGALARPVWTLLPFAADYRWMLDREDSPWYPTMRLFRQSRPGDWPGVVARILNELRKLI